MGCLGGILGCLGEILWCLGGISGCLGGILGYPGGISGYSGEISLCPGEILGYPGKISLCPGGISLCPGGISGFPAGPAAALAPCLRSSVLPEAPRARGSLAVPWARAGAPGEGGQGHLARAGRGGAGPAPEPLGAVPRRGCPAGSAAQPRLGQHEEAPAALGAGHLQPPLRQAPLQPQRRLPVRHQPALDLHAGGDLGQRGWHRSVSPEGGEGRDGRAGCEGCAGLGAALMPGHTGSARCHRDATAPVPDLCPDPGPAALGELNLSRRGW